MPKKQSLVSALQESIAPTATEPKILDDTNPGMSSPRTPERLIPQSRQGKKTIAGHFDPAVSRQLKEIALAEDSSVQALLCEALNDLFTKRGKPPIAS